MGMDTLDQGANMPIIKILQKSSAEVDKDHEHYKTKKVEGAEPGDLYFMGAQLLLGKEVEIIPLSQKTMYAEWRPQNQGGGLVAHHPVSIVTDDAYRKGTGDKKHKEYLGGNDLLLTVYFMVLFRKGDEWERAIIPFTSSNLKHARAWTKQIRSFRYDSGEDPCIFSRSFTLSTLLCRGNGSSWYEFQLNPKKVLDLAGEDKALCDQCVEAFKDAVAALPAPESDKPAAITAAPDEDPY